jgi:heme oxygenase
MITQQELRQACHEYHEQAEKTPLAQALITGTVTSVHYKQLMWQLYMIADALESRVNLGMGDLQRRHLLAQDCAHSGPGNVSTLLSTSTYVSELMSLREDQLRGHVYVHYMGWLYGGQMLRKALKLPTAHLQFQNVKACVDHIRSNILVDIATHDADQAQRGFQSIIEIYNELYSAG